MSSYILNAALLSILSSICCVCPYEWWMYLLPWLSIYLYMLHLGKHASLTHSLTLVMSYMELIIDGLANAVPRLRKWAGSSFKLGTSSSSSWRRALEKSEAAVLSKRSRLAWLDRNLKPLHARTRRKWKECTWVSDRSVSRSIRPKRLLVISVFMQFLSWFFFFFFLNEQRLLVGSAFARSAVAPSN